MIFWLTILGLAFGLCCVICLVSFVARCEEDWYCDPSEECEQCDEFRKRRRQYRSHE